MRIVRCKDGEQLVRVAQIDEPEDDETPGDAAGATPGDAPLSPAAGAADDGAGDAASDSEREENSDDDA